MTTTTTDPVVTYTDDGRYLLIDGFSVAEVVGDQLHKLCRRCGGSGHYSYNPSDGTVCYGCGGDGHAGTTTLDNELRLARNRAKAAARRAAKETARLAAQEAAHAAWAAAHPELAAALDTLAETDGWLPDFLQRMVTETRWRALTPRQTEAAEHALASWRERETAAADRAARARTAGHLGTVGEKLTAEVEVSRVLDIDSQWGTSFLVIMRTAEGHVLKTFSSGAFGREAEQGQRLTITGTVKEHGEYEGVPQTTLTRVKGVSTAPDAARL